MIPDWVEANGYPLARHLDGDLWLTVQPITFGRWRVVVCTETTNNVEAY